MLALIASVALETDPVRRRLHDMRVATVGRKPAWQGSMWGTQLILIAGGMGKANAAQAITALLETTPVRGVIGFGVGGAYPGCGLEVGGLALATREIYGDEGVAIAGGWLSTEEIGIPLLEGVGDGRPCYNEIPTSVQHTAAASEALARHGVEHRGGPFVTVSACSGTELRGRELEDRFDAICESMEGAAYAHVARLYEVPFVEVRGISNRVEDRDMGRWRLPDAAEAAAAAVEAIVREWR